MVCGELKHAFLQRMGSTGASEPFIEGFVRSYVRHSDDPEAGFGTVTRKLPFFMGLTELRIARNRYLPVSYRSALAREGIQCLKHGLAGLC